MTNEEVEKVRFIYRVYYRMHRESIENLYMNDKEFKWHGGAIAGMRCILYESGILTKDDIQDIETSVDEGLIFGDNPQ